MGGQLIGYPEIAPNSGTRQWHGRPQKDAPTSWDRRLPAEQGVRRSHDALGAARGFLWTTSSSKPAARGSAVSARHRSWAGMRARIEDSNLTAVGGQHIILRAGGGGVPDPDSLVLQALTRGCMLCAPSPVLKRPAEAGGWLDVRSRRPRRAPGRRQRRLASGPRAARRRGARGQGGAAVARG